MLHPLFTPELRNALAHQAGRPLRLVDPETNAAYVLVAEELFARFMPGDADDASGSAGAQSNGLGADDWDTERQSAEFPTIGTPEWGRMNRRRAELIRKKLRGQLTEDEHRQYEWLQRRSLEALNAACPLPGPQTHRV